MSTTKAEQIADAVDAINNYIANGISSTKFCIILNISEEKFFEINQEYGISSESAANYSDEYLVTIAEALLL